MQIKNFQAVYPFEGYVMESVNCHPLGIQINLRRDRRRALRCPDCGGKMAQNRESESSAFDLSCGGGPVVLVRYPCTQGRCSSCGSYKTVRPAEIHPTRKATWRLMRFVSRLSRFVPFDAMSALIEVPAATAWRYDQAVLAAELPEPNLDGLEALLIDEKAVRKGHGYVTLVLDAQSGELLHMHEGKKKASLETFFEKLTAEQKASIRAVCIDRNGAYRSVVDEQLPGAEVVFDRFHLMSNLGKAVDEVRREEHRAAGSELKHVIKGQRFNLLRHPENLTPQGELALDNLLEINANIHTAYVLKDQFRLLWTYRKAGWARRYLTQWITWARTSAIGPLCRFANGIERDIEQVLSWFRHPLSNARIESFNSIVARVLFKTRGIRSLDYLYLKLRQESLLQI